MSLNFLGLGFAFGAKDNGLKTKQRQYAAGFGNISDELGKMGKKASGSAGALSGMTEDMSGSAMDKLTASVDKLAMSLGDGLPKAGHRGAEAFHNTSNDIVSSEEHIGGGFNFIRDAVEKLNSILRLNKLQTFLQSISLARLNDIAHGVENIATNGLNLTTSFEETIIASNKTARSMGANFGLAGKSLGRFTDQATSMGISLNIGADKAGEAAYNVTLATKELGAVGLKSAADLAKFAEVSGVSAGDITQTFKQAGQQFHLTDKQLRQLAGSALESGKQIGDIGGQFKQMPHILDLIARRAAVLGKKFDPQQMADFASQTLAVSGALYNMGASAEEAREAATSLAEKMVESGENFGNMFAGTSSDLSEFHMALSIAGGDTKQAFDSMTQGPGEFMSGLADMVSKGKKSGKDVGAMMNLMRGQLEKVFGPKQTARMMDFFQKADQATLDSMKTVSKADGNLGKFAKEGFSTGRSLAQSFELMKDKFVMSFRNIGRSAAVDFVDKTGKEFDKFNSQMQALVKKGGPLGQLIEKFSEIHQIGALALIPKTLRPLASVFGEVIKEAGPMLGVLGALGFRFEMLLSPVAAIALAGAALGVWFASLRMEGKSTGEAMKIMADKISIGAKKLWKTVKAWTSKLFDYLSSIDWSSLFTRVFDSLASVLKDAGNLLKKIPWAGILDGVLSSIGKVFGFIASKRFGEALTGVFDFLGNHLTDYISIVTTIFQKVFSGIADIDFERVGTVVSGLFSRIFDSVFTTVKKILPTLFGVFESLSGEGFRTVMARVGSGLASGAKVILNTVFDALDNLLSYLGDINLSQVLSNILKSLNNITEVLLNTLSSVAGTALNRVAQVLIRIPGMIMDTMVSVLPLLGKWLGEVGEMFKRVLPRIVGVVADTIWTLLKALPDLFMKAVRTFPAILDGLASLIKGAVSFLVSTLVGLFQGIEDWLSNKFPSAAGVIHGIFTVLKTMVEAVGAVIRGAITAVTETFKFLWKIVGGILSALGTALGVVGEILKTSAVIVGKIVAGAWSILSAAVSVAWSVIEPIVRKLGDIIGWVGEKISWLAGKVAGAASAVGGFFKRVGSSALDLVAGTKGVASALDKSMKEVQDSATQRASFVGEAIKAIVDSTIEHVGMIVKAYEEQNKAEIDIAMGTLSTEKDKFAAIGAVQKKFAADTAAVLANVPDAVRQAASTAQGELNRAFYEQLKVITFDEKMSLDERKKALEGLEQWKRSKMDEFSALVSKQAQEMTASGGASAKAMEDAFGKMVDGVAGKANEAALKASAAVGTVQHELGVTAEEALNNLKNIAAIDPKKFASDLKVIKEVYIDFSKTAQNEAQNMLVATGKAFEAFNKQAIDHWIKQKSNVSMMVLTDDDVQKLTESVGKTVERAFTALTAMITSKVEDSVTKAFSSAFAKVIVQAKKFVKDSMDVFGDLGKQMVKRFGDAWIKILEFTSSAIDAIEKDSSRAISDLQKINLAMRASASMQPLTAGANVSQNDVKLTIGKSELENIFQATHHPDWYEKDFKFRVMEILMSLNNLAAALSSSSSRQPVNSGSSSRSAASKINSANIGLGDNRAIARLNGAVQ
jgi:phage-related protein